MMSSATLAVIKLILWVVAVWILPFFAYFVGIVIRKKAIPGPDSPPLNHQLLLGIPICLLVVSPQLTIFNAVRADVPAYLVSMGLIIEQGMLVQETVTRRIANLRQRNQVPVPPMASPAAQAPE